MPRVGDLLVDARGLRIRQRHHERRQTGEEHAEREVADGGRSGAAAPERHRQGGQDDSGAARRATPHGPDCEPRDRSDGQPPEDEDGRVAPEERQGAVELTRELPQLRQRHSDARREFG